MYSKDINRVVSQNVDFKRIVSEGGGGGTVGSKYSTWTK